MSHPTAIDVFSGAGGLTEGLRQARFRVLGAIESDPVAVQSYRMNHVGTEVFEADVRCITAKLLCTRLNVRKGELDLLAGCPPCQPFSNLRTRNRKAPIVDSGSDLIFDFLRLAKGLLPKAIMLENVPNLASDERFAVFASALEGYGYRVEHSILDAQHFGVPQRRRRLVLLAQRGRIPRFPKRARRLLTVADAIAKLPPAGASGDPLHDIAEHRTAHIMRLIRAIPPDGGSRASVPNELLLPCHRQHQGHYDVFGRLAWNAPAATITGGCHNPSRGRFLHPIEHRALTLREAALLQSFPPGYKFSLARGKEHAAQQIGNALPPELIRRIAVALLRNLGA